MKREALAESAPFCPFHPEPKEPDDEGEPENYFENYSENGHAAAPRAFRSQ
jgi:hypothetical protein